MKWLLIAICIEAVAFLGDAVFKFSVDPDMGMSPKARKKYVRAAWKNFAITVGVTIAIWWFWHPISNFLWQDWSKFIEQHRP